MAVLGLSWDLPCVMGDLSLWHVDSLFAVQGLSSCSTQAELLCGISDLSSLTRDRTHVLCIVRQILNHWTVREVPGIHILNLLSLYEKRKCYGKIHFNVPVNQKQNSELN